MKITQGRLSAVTGEEPTRLTAQPLPPSPLWADTHTYLPAARRRRTERGSRSGAENLGGDLGKGAAGGEGLSPHQSQGRFRVQPFAHHDDPDGLVVFDQ